MPRLGQDLRDCAVGSVVAGSARGWDRHHHRPNLAAGALYAGIDVAEAGDDETVCVVRSRSGRIIATQLFRTVPDASGHDAWSFAAVRMILRSTTDIFDGMDRGGA